ncbi:hypothetical protein ABFS82_14G171800 [Erythranthe guttata]
MYSRKTVSIIISLCIIIACCFTSSLEASRHLSMTTTTPTNSPSFNADRTGRGFVMNVIVELIDDKSIRLIVVILERCRRRWPLCITTCAEMLTFNCYEFS